MKQYQDVSLTIKTDCFLN